MTEQFDGSLQCPLPLQRYPYVLLAHGGGGRLMHDLIQDLFLATFGDSSSVPHDAAVLSLPGQRLAFTTDSYVVRPLIFPGGTIGSLAIHGTVNDLAMAGARPLYISAGFILEEGLSMATLWRVVQSMQQAATQCGVKIVTGDTKVVDRGKGDGIFINTAGIGVVECLGAIAPPSIQPGDAVILSGDIGRHGIAIMAVRDGLAFETRIESDSAPVAATVLALLEAGVEVHCLRDLTRGGLSSALNELAIASRTTITIHENQIPIREDVRGACEILGLDPLYVANEGRFMAIVPAQEVERALAVMRSHAPDPDPSLGPCKIGVVTDTHPGRVILNTPLEVSRILDMLSGEQLPRIC
jgi:hydrogenase expression/formation protein HypE